MEQAEQPAPKRRRRRRRRKGPRSGGETTGVASNRGLRRDLSGPTVNLPATGQAPNRRMALHPTRGRPNSSTSRRRRFSRADLEHVSTYLSDLPEQYVANLYSGLGGQPDRVPSRERMIQLTSKALGQDGRMNALVRSIHQRDRQALAILIQCGGLAHHSEFCAELTLSLGGTEKEWTRVLGALGQKGLIAATEEKEAHFFYLIPQPLMGPLIDAMKDDLGLPTFEHEEMRILNQRPFSPPLDFSLTTLATYIGQHPPRLTQRQEIFKVHKDEMDAFFGQVWDPDSELFSFHIEFLMTNGMVELRGDSLHLNRAAIEEWLQLDPEDQRDLAFHSLNRRLPSAEWLIWAIYDMEGAWVAERPLQALYRRWRRGEDWRERYRKGQWSSPKTAQREGYSFAPLADAGILELGQWGQEKFYRLSTRALRLVEPPEDEGFTQFYLTPSFEIMAPAGMAPILFFRIGELAELTACDRANTYKITEVSIEQALEKGWRREDIFEFLRENSQIGLPENVEDTLRGWCGQRGDVEFHDLTMLSIHRSQIRRLETNRAIKPFLLHRFVPGLYAVDRARMDELKLALNEGGFSVAPQVRAYPDDPAGVDARKRLLDLVSDARAGREDTLTRAHAADTDPSLVTLIPGTKAAAKKGRRKKSSLPTRRSPREVQDVVAGAIKAAKNLDMIYVTRAMERKRLTVKPERIATNAQGQQVLVASVIGDGGRFSYQVVQIERMDAV
ncbi:MAG: helicase-associated domain-containing protein [Myxococcota bacterium]|nr:helicase-associated domain-containing protein [Myxococcota bacterium]